MLKLLLISTLLATLCYGGSFTTTTTPPITVTYTVNANTVTYTVVCQTTNWIAFGVNTQAQMIGTDAAIYMPTTGTITKWYIKDKTVGAIVQAATQDLTGTSVTTNGGTTTLVFTRPIAANGDTGESIALTPASSQNYVFASGPATTFSQHSTTANGLAVVNLNSGTAFGATSSTAFTPWRLTHGAFMLISFGMMIPIGMFVSRYLRGKFDNWFKLHIWIQYTALGIFFIGFWIAVGGCASEQLPYNTPHQQLGVALFLLVIAQPINGYFRPQSDGGKISMRHWRLFHYWYGRALIFLGVIQIFMGIVSLDPTGTASSYKGFMAVYILWFLGAIGFIGYMEFKRYKAGVSAVAAVNQAGPPPASPTNSGAAGTTAPTYGDEAAR